MSLMLPFIGMFIFVGLSQSTLTQRTYVRMLAVILLICLYFYFSSPY